MIGNNTHKAPPQHRVPSQVKKLICDAIVAKPNITGLELSLGQLHPKKAAALCPSLANIDRLNEIRKNCLSKIYSGPLDVFTIPRMFELKEKNVKKNYCDETFLQLEVSKWLFPYLRNFVNNESNTWIHTQCFSQSYLTPFVDCLVIDVKHDKHLHHFGICGFLPVLNKTVMLCRVQMNSLTADSYRIAFVHFLNTLMEDGIDLNNLFDEICRILVVLHSTIYMDLNWHLERYFQKVIWLKN